MRLSYDKLWYLMKKNKMKKVDLLTNFFHFLLTFQPQLRFCGIP